MTTLIKRLLPQFSLQNILFKRLSREKNVLLTARRIYILPTREGVYYAIIILLLLSGAMNYNNSLLFIFTFFLAGVGIITMYHTHNNLLNIDVRALNSKAVFEGEDIIVPVKFSVADKMKNPRLNLFLEIEPSKESKTLKSKKNRVRQINNTKNISKVFFDVGLNEANTVELKIKSVKRGYLKTPRLTLSSRYPLGFLKAWSNLLLDKNYLVYPKPISSKELDNIKLSSDEGVGDQGFGIDEFSELREKQDSDSFSHVHWKAYARSDKFLVKQYGGKMAENIHLKWDDFRQYSTEMRISIFTRILLNAFQNHQSFSLELPNESVSLGADSGHLHKCLKLLALYPTD